jgi:uncharacterized protein (DUF697 family)
VNNWGVTRTLVRSHEHLATNRRLILGHTLASSLVGMVPIPYVSEWLPAVVKRDMIRRIAESRGVDLDEAAERMIAEGEVARPGWRSLISATPLLGFARRSLRAVFVAWNLYRQAEGAARTFALATLFDHYCARLHVGGELGLDGARDIRKRMEAAASSPAGGVATWALRRVFIGALQAAWRAPAQIAASVAARRRLKERGEVEAEEIAEETVSHAGSDTTLLGRAADSAMRLFFDAGRGYVDRMVDAFDRDERDGR